MVTNNLNIIEEIQTAQRLRSQKIGCEGLASRLHSLTQLKEMLVTHESEWLQALNKDLHKPEVEAYASEIGVLLNEIDFITKNLARWMKPDSKRRLLLVGIDKAITSRFPYGSVLVLSPWNYPLQLALMPVIGALASGNGVVLKPSEFSPATSALLARLVPLYFPQDTFYVIEGDDMVAEGLTNLHWDFVFFTGSPRVGSKVYQAAARHLTPVSLELGGKNPCILDESGLTEDAIQKIAWGKFLNAGQSCIAPDTVYVPSHLLEPFLEKMKKQIHAFYGDFPEQSPDYGRIINTKQFHQVLQYLGDGTIYYGGENREETCFIAPTLLTAIKPGSAITKEEIFGPILPVIPYDSLATLKEELNQLPPPLCTYVFSSKKETIKQLAKGLKCGTFVVNEIIIQAVNPHIAFGGIGKSGIGRYHGKASFETFTYLRADYSKWSLLSLKQQFPPYTNLALNALRKLRKKIF